MRLIPVLDLMNGLVVHGIRGERSQYRPVESCLTSSAEPLPVARALKAETGCREFYIADLDALQCTGDHRDHIAELAGGLSADLWIDAGITDAASAQRVLNYGADKIIICTESLPDRETLDAIAKAIDYGRMVFSIDIVNGRVISKAPFLKGLSPLDALEMVSGHGWLNFILLTLDHVGTGSGPDWELLETARHRFPQLTFFAGGGIHIPEDIDRLISLNIDGALVATALHRGWITARHIRDMGLNAEMV